MSIAYWCVFIAILLPTGFAWVAKSFGGFRLKHNSAPREFMGELTGWSQRANWAQQNTLESIPAFMAAVIIAHQMGGEQSTIDVLAVSYIVLRVLYGVLYIVDVAWLRSIVWTLALACILGLFFS